MNIPVVTVHSYNAKSQKTDYTSHVLNQSCFLKNLTFSLTDYVPNVSTKIESHTNILFESLKTKEYELFMNNYVHMSTNKQRFEQTAISKFFLLKEFMQKFNFTKIFHIDSDVLLYKNISFFEDYYSHYDFTLTYNQQCGNSFFTLEMLQDLCEKILKIYIDRDKYFWFVDLQKIYERTPPGQPGGICDMTILKHYKERKECNSRFTCGEMSEIVDGFRFDHHIRSKDDSYEMDGERRKIEFINNTPNSFNKNLNKHIKYLSLHFGGKAKEYLHEYITYV